MTHSCQICLLCSKVVYIKFQTCKYVILVQQFPKIFVHQKKGHKNTLDKKGSLRRKYRFCLHISRGADMFQFHEFFHITINSTRFQLTVWTRDFFGKSARDVALYENHWKLFWGSRESKMDELEKLRTRHRLQE